MINKTETLKKLGLSSYESAVYLSLIGLISAKAVEISDHSKVPRSKVYDVLKSLHKKKFIEIQKSRPIIYTVIPPREVIKREKNALIKDFNEMEIELNEIYENKISQVQAPMWLIHGEERIIQKELEIIKRATKSINMRIGFLFGNELEQLKEVLSKKKKIQINILTSNNIYLDNKKVDLSDYFNQDNIIIKKTFVPQVKMIIRDEKELLHVYSLFKDNKKDLIPNTSIGVWNQYEEIANNYNDRFIKQMKKIRNK